MTAMSSAIRSSDMTAAASSISSTNGGSDADALDNGDATPPLEVVNAYNRLDDTDLVEARMLGLLRAEMEVSHDANAPGFGVVLEKKGGSRAAGCCAEVFPSQRALQDRCKQLAMARGFQLVVSCSSTRPNGGGNVKYRCKKLHGQQFLDASVSADDQSCPFYINGFGNGPRWKITRACFLHNHYKFIGGRSAPQSLDASSGAVAPSELAGMSQTLGGALSDTVDSDGPIVGDSSKQRKQSAKQRNTTLSTKALCQLVTDEVNSFPTPQLVLERLDNKLIKRILLSRGHAVNHMMASRIKRTLLESRVDAVRTSFQGLGGYLTLVAEKNPGSLLKLETTDGGVFQRALFVPSAALHVFKRSRKVIAVDRIRRVVPELTSGSNHRLSATDDDAICGVYLKAMGLDWNDDVVTLALALVTDESQANWEWFLTALATGAAVDMAEYTVVAGRANGLAEALASVWPLTPHRFCMRRIIEDELVTARKLALTYDQRQRVVDLARSESESEFNAQRAELIRADSAIATAAVRALDALPRPQWVKFAFLETFRRPTFDEVTCDLDRGASLKEKTSDSIDDADSVGDGSDGRFALSATHTSWFSADAVRSSQPLATFNAYFMRLAQLFHERRSAVAQRAAKELVPTRLAQMERILQGSQRCESIPCANGAFMVRSLGQTRPQIFDTWRHVNLLDWECTCQEWQDRLFPCVHAIHAAELERRRIDTLYDTALYSVEYYRASYGASFVPWPLEAAVAREADANMQSPLDVFLAVHNAERKKPGPKPKPKAPVVVAMSSSDDAAMIAAAVERLS